MVKILFLCFGIICPFMMHANPSDTKYYLYSSPKSGTHLLCKLMQLIHGHVRIHGTSYDIYIEDEMENFIEENWSKGMVTHTHWFPSNRALTSLNNKGFKMIAIVRDPRDQLISLIHFIHKNKNYFHSVCSQFKEIERPLSDLEVEEILDIILVNQQWPYASSHLQRYFDTHMISYIPEDTFIKIPFEELIGEKGGGSLQKQIDILDTLLTFFNKDHTESTIQTIVDKLFGGTATFREGQIGTWQKHFTRERRKKYNFMFGSLIYNLGYEKDTSWMEILDEENE